MAVPTDYVMTVHLTEYDAENDLLPIGVTGGATSGLKNILDVSSASTQGYFTHKKYYYRINSVQQCKKFYVDWDDGENNRRKEKANYSIKEYDVQQKYAVFPHTYTKHGPFFPKITLTNKDGFESKYYTPSFGDLSSLAQVQTITCVPDVSDSLNQKYFILYNGFNKPYYIWFDTDNSGSTVVVPEGYTSAEVTAVTTGMTAAQVAEQVQLKITSLGSFSATLSAPTVTVTNATKGKCNFPQAGTSGFTMAVTTYGAKDDFSSIDAISPSTPRETVGLVEIDSLASPRIPVLCPSNVPPIGVLSIDRTQVYAGIDNDYLEGGSYLCYLYLDGKDSYDAGVTSINGFTLRASHPTANKIDNVIEIVWKDDKGIIHKDTKSVASAGSIAGAIVGTAGSVYVKEILRVKLLKVLEGDSSNTQRLFPYERVHILAYATGGSPTLPIGNVGSASKTICQVSLGNPLLKENDTKYSLVMDGSQSYTRNSNATIKNYNYDVSKLEQGDTVSNISTPTYVSDLIDFTPQTSPSKKISYTFDIESSDQVDRDLRFFNTERLIRLQVQDTSEDNRMSNNDLLTFSEIEHDDSQSLANGFSSSYPDFINNKAALLYFESVRNSVWVDLAARNRTNNTFVMGSTGGGSYSFSSTTDVSGAADCFLLIVKEKPFNKIHFRMENALEWATGILGTDSHQMMGMQMWYSSNKASSIRNGWTPLSFFDGTEIFKNRTGTAGPDSDVVDSFGRPLSTSGSIIFDTPTDWVKATPITMRETDALSTLIGTVPNTGTSSADPDDLWDFEGYAVLIGFSPNTLPTLKNCVRVHTYNNSHSKAVKIIDPMHVSLNNFGITKSISYSRVGSHNIMTDKLGRAEIRKIGAKGGSISFGTHDLSESLGGEREILNRFQKSSTPVYLDIERKDSTSIRFYGVITNISEEFPTGGALNSLGITMNVENVIECASDGDWSEILSLGGIIEYEQNFMS